MLAMQQEMSISHTLTILFWSPSKKFTLFFPFFGKVMEPGIVHLGLCLNGFLSAQRRVPAQHDLRLPALMARDAVPQVGTSSILEGLFFLVLTSDGSPKVPLWKMFMHRQTPGYEHQYFTSHLDSFFTYGFVDPQRLEP